jgi:hypothetical protein
MIITKENGAQYTSLSKEIINWHKDTGHTIAFVERPLAYKTKEEELPSGEKIMSQEYVDDITPEEVEAGKEAIRGFLYRTETDPLYFKVEREEIEKQVWLDAVAAIKAEWA